MSTVYKPKNKKTFVINYYFRGKRYQRGLGVKRESLAIEKQKDFDYWIDKGIDPDTMLSQKSVAGEITLDAFEDEFLDHYRKNKNYSKRTIESYEWNFKLLKEYFIQRFGKSKVPLSKLTSKIIENDLKPYLYNHYKNENTVSHILTHFRAIYSRAVFLDYIEKNPFHKRIKAAPGNDPNPVSKDEIETLKKYFTQEEIPNWQYDIIFLGLNTGLRKSELCNLNWDQIDFSKRELKFPGKGQKVRIVPLNNDAYQILQNRSHNKIKSIDNRVFEITLSALESAWRRMKEKTKIKKGIHSLRDTFATKHYEVNRDIMVLRDILGHSDVKVTQRYAKVVNIHAGINKISFM